jgi:glucokinase
MSNSIDTVVSVDLGGTNIKFGLIDTEGRVLMRTRRETRARQGRDEVIERIYSGVQECLDAADGKVLGIGICSPGPLDSQAGIVFHTPNMPGWENAPLREMLAEKFGIPVNLENDGSAAARGENWIGAGKDVDDMIQLTLGTGIGGGIILKNRLWTGFQHCAGELGHTTVNYNGRLCGCGRKGCIEPYANASGFVMTFMEHIERGEKPKFYKKGDKVTPKLISQWADDGDEVAASVIEETGKVLGVAVTNLVNALNPQMVVISGGIARAGERLFKPLRETVKERAMYPMAEELQIVPSIAEDDAGIIGAARCLLDTVEDRILNINEL